MGHFNMQKAKWAILFLTTALQSRFVASVYVSPHDLMKCSYGERGSLTATCVNATATYFKSTPYRFDQLDETLKCVNCSLQIIDSGSFDISGNQIKNLDLTNSKIITIRQRAFVGLIFLENLILSNNNIGAIYPNTFAGVKKIKSVDLSKNEIQILSDDGFLELKNLETLNLAHNGIHTISPRAFNGLSNIRELDLGNNQITDLKDAFFNLTSLQVLNLGNNRLVTLKGTEFYNLTSLLELNIATNKLQSFTIEFQPQSVLKNLLLQDNYINKIAPDSLKGLHSLEILDLSYNQINLVSQKALQSLYKLHSLNLPYNKLTNIKTGAYTALPHLELLNCSHNQIMAIEITGVFSLDSLHYLDVSYNALSDLDYVGLLSRLPRLAYLKLDHNKLPCDLEDDMTAYFAEDNFKFVLDDNSESNIKCEPISSHIFTNDINDPDTVKESKISRGGTTGAEMTIIVMLSIIFVCMGFLFFLQYRTYRQMGISRTNRAMSSANLMDSEPKDNEDYLRE